MADVLPFRRPDKPAGLPAYAPGVAPFDRSNPAHVQAWNALYQFGREESRRRHEEIPDG